jgi:predicted outer membrane repeat protein
VVTSSSTNNTAVLDGFTITGGNANSASFPYNYGGGLFDNVGNPILSNLTISSNSASVQGGGMYVLSGNPQLNNVTFNTNTSGQYGGGMFSEKNSSPKLTGVVFNRNTATKNGGGMSSSNSGASGTGNPILARVTFNSNTAGINGGGMYNYAMSSPRLTNVIFTGNKAEYGGGMFNELHSSPTLLDVTFNGNQANYQNSAGNGGGMGNFDYSNPHLTNVTFFGNSAIQYGGGLYNSQNNNPVLTNVTFSGNTAGIRGGGMVNVSSTLVSVYDSIFWNDTTGDEIWNSDSTTSLTIADSLVQGSCPLRSTCTHILNSDPLLGPLQNNGGFTQTMALGIGSPAINTGNNATCATTDQRGVPRPQPAGGTCDMGAYEYQVP